MADIKVVKTDMEKAEKGVWVPFESGIELCIASANSPEFRKARSRVMKQFTRRIRSKSVNPDEVLEALKPVYAKHILVGWKNIEEDGQEVSYSANKALEYFRDPSLSIFFDFVLEASGDDETFRMEDFEEAEKNSGQISGGSSDSKTPKS